MPRTLSTPAMRAMLAQETGECWLFFLTLSHPQLDPPIRVVNDHVNHDVDGVTWVGYHFDVTMPPETDGSVPRVRLSIDNIDRSIVTALRQLPSSPTVSFRIALATSPAVTEAGPFDFTLHDATYDALVVEGELRYEDVLNEPCPAELMSPNSFPGLF